MNSNLRDILSQGTSKVLIDSLSERVINNDGSFHKLYLLSFDEDRKVAWHALWACSKISESHPAFLQDKYDELVERVMNTDDSGSIRLILNIVLHLDQPKEINVAFLDYCINNMSAPEKSSACQALCMKIAYKISKEKYPELLSEIKMILENMDKAYYKPAAISARNSILKKIEKNIKRI